MLEWSEDRVIAEYERHIRMFARNLTPSYEDDIVQETFLRLLKANGRVRNPKQWALKVARNLCYDELRRRKPESIDNFEGEVYEDNCGNDLAELVIQRVRALPESTYIAVLEMRLEGCTYRQIQQKFSISRGTVGRIISCLRQIAIICFLNQGYVIEQKRYIP
jgi:RNA polymerase sigma factor (sigma-70 family)